MSVMFFFLNKISFPKNNRLYVSHGNAANKQIAFIYYLLHLCSSSSIVVMVNKVKPI